MGEVTWDHEMIFTTRCFLKKKKAMANNSIYTISYLLIRDREVLVPISTDSQEPNGAAPVKKKKKDRERDCALAFHDF